MVKEVIELDGTVKETLRGGKFRVTVDGQSREIIAVMSGKIRTHHIKIVVGDRVKLEFSPYDLNNGRISFRYSGFGKRLDENDGIANEEKKPEVKHISAEDIIVDSDI
ncbi:MAG: translation initiation factor IF-1 [Patescibacteria group bacterium]|nr:translation initiation factor IF-1 [Patescibacteria group bacterium]